MAPRDPTKCCGANTPDGPCGHWKGFRTNHPGFGRCYRHGGNTRNHQVAANKEIVKWRMRTYGNARVISPEEALKEEVWRTAGHVQWLGDLVADLLHEGDGYEAVVRRERQAVLSPAVGTEADGPLGPLREDLRLGRDVPE